MAEKRYKRRNGPFPYSNPSTKVGCLFKLLVYESKNSSASALHCCKLGMKLASFATEEIFADFVAIVPGLFYLV